MTSNLAVVGSVPRPAFAAASDLTGSIWVCRHGERADAIPGWEETAERPHDPPLTPRGLAQAAATAGVLASERIDAIYCSPFLRCMQTAAAIAAPLGLRIRVEPGLGELLNPRWFSTHPVDAAMSDEALVAAIGEALIDRTYTPVYDTAARRGATAAGAESDGAPAELCFPETSPLEAAARYERTLDALRGVGAPCFALLVTHGFGVQAIAESVDGVEVLECDYCALTRLTRRGGSASGDEGVPWRCDVLCRSTHIVGVEPA